MRNDFPFLMSVPVALLICLAILLRPAVAQETAVKPPVGSVIFIHPDGAGASMWAVGRALWVGPDNDLHWDKLPHVAVYKDHVADSINASSNAGGTIHAYGIKVPYRSFGMNGNTPIVDEKGQSLSVARQAMRHGMAVALLNSGTSTEPGTACFMASVTARSNHDEIMAQLVESGVDILMGGGEGWTLPQGMQGRHGPGLRQDGRNLIEEARQAGYTVVFTREELLALPSDTQRVLGVFAHDQTFNDVSEEALAEKGLPPYWPYAPTLAEMTQVALRILEAKDKPFFAMIEEEGTDNFANANNARDTLLALKRADDAIGLARDYLARHPHTLLLVAADSNAGAMHMLGIRPDKEGNMPETVGRSDPNGAAYDGVDGTETAPFLSQPDRSGVRLPFAVVWGTLLDAAGGVVVRAQGLNADLVRGTMDNTQIAQLIRLTLFGTTTP